MLFNAPNFTLALCCAGFLRAQSDWLNHLFDLPNPCGFRAYSCCQVPICGFSLPATYSTAKRHEPPWLILRRRRSLRFPPLLKSQALYSGEPIWGFTIWGFILYFSYYFVRVSYVPNYWCSAESLRVSSPLLLPKSYCVGFPRHQNI